MAYKVLLAAAILACMCVYTSAESFPVVTKCSTSDYSINTINKATRLHQIYYCGFNNIRGELIFVDFEVGLTYEIKCQRTRTTTKWPEICRIMRLTRNCSDGTYRAACKSSCSIECSPAFIYLGTEGSCYAMASGTSAIWAYAVEYCRAYDSELAVFENAQDSQALTTLYNLILPTNLRFYLGALNAGTDKEWYWVDRRPFVGGYWRQLYVDVDKANCLVAYKNANWQHESNSCNQNVNWVCKQIPVFADA